MPHASGIGDSTGGAAQAGRTDRHEASPVKVIASMQIPQHGEEHGSYSFTIANRLRSSAVQVWEHASTIVGFNPELWPLARRTFPPALGRLTPGAIPLGRGALRG